MSSGDVGLHTIEDDPLWYKDAIIYQLHPRAYFDSNADGIGDFRGLVEKLDYIQDLGVTAIWVLPFYPSPLRDDGYDIADYTDVHPAYGTVRDVRLLVREAHRRGLRVITELVCNHTSDQHPWFQRARQAKPGSGARNFYVWTDNPDKYREARIIFKDFESSNWTWDPVANAYFWHRFYHHQPDLNFDNPRVRQAIFNAMDFWLKMGIDGLRLDAIPYLYEREGTNCENLPETHDFLKALRRHVDANFANRMLLAEANQWPEDAVAYFGDGDECHMSFNFPLMPRMFMAIRMEDRYPIIDILDQTPPIPENTQWAIFLRNHDELTLEMVTDEERDYMYRVYADDPQMRINLGIRRRLAPLLNNNRRRIELLNGLMFSLPGTPVIYYGDELGMGDNIYLGDRNGVRTPMQWSGDRNAGFSDASRQRLYLPVIVDAEYHYEAVNVEAQQNNPHSLLWWMKRLIAIRKRYQAFGRGSLEFLHPDNRKILAFVRRYEDETILVVANLSRFVQAAELDLADFRGMVPVEVFGRTEFPPIGELPYFVTMGPHAFFWFTLEQVRIEQPRSLRRGREPLMVTSGWDQLMVGKGRDALAERLPEYIRGRRWFGGKSRTITGLKIVDAVPFPYSDATAYCTMLQLTFTQGDPDRYVLPMAYATGEQAAQIAEEYPYAVITQVRSRVTSQEGILYDPTVDPSFGGALFEAIRGRRRLRGAGELVAARTPAFSEILSLFSGEIRPMPVRSEQSNTSLNLSDQFILKLYRRVEPGVNPDLELTRFLTSHGFEHTARVAGWIEYRDDGKEPATLALLQAFMPNQGNAWDYTQDALARYFDGAAAASAPAPETPSSSTASLLEQVRQPIPDEVRLNIDLYLQDARLLGQRTAEMHAVLAQGREPSMAPEPFNSFYQRSIYQSMRTLAGQVFHTLRRSQAGLEEPARDRAVDVLELEAAIMSRYRSLISRRIEASRIRCHGDYHLGQLLSTGRDFVIIDFEGEPARTLSERRMKRSPLVDVAGMLRSFNYAAFSSLFEARDAGTIGMVRSEDLASLEPWARYWNFWVSVAFLQTYLETAGPQNFLPSESADLELLLDAYLLDKAIYEVGYELNNRPSWVGIPLEGILQLAEAPVAARS